MKLKGGSFHSYRLLLLLFFVVLRCSLLFFVVLRCSSLFFVVLRCSSSLFVFCCLFVVVCCLFVVCLSVDCVFDCLVACVLCVEGLLIVHCPLVVRLVLRPGFSRN